MHRFPYFACTHAFRTQFEIVFFSFAMRDGEQEIICISMSIIINFIHGFFFLANFPTQSQFLSYQQTFQHIERDEFNVCQLCKAFILHFFAFLNGKIIHFRVMKLA